MKLPRFRGRSTLGMSTYYHHQILRAAAAAAGAILLLGCQLNPTITVAMDSTGTVLTINGSGFSPNTNPCAHLGLIGLPVGTFPPQGIGTAACNPNGSFSYPITYTLSYVPGCNPSSAISVDVSAIDIKTSSITFSNITIPWGSNCALYGSCGKIGLPACPNTDNACYISGGVGGDGKCVACGGQGQPPCTNPSGVALETHCNQGFHPQYQGPLNNVGQPQPPVVCTAYCGYFIGAREPCSVANLGSPDCSGAPGSLIQPESACITQESGAYGPVKEYTCYGDSVTQNSATVDTMAICQQVRPRPDRCYGIKTDLYGHDQTVDLDCKE
jgi:hypothetical protein